jgi:hypothetical protein
MHRFAILTFIFALIPTALALAAEVTTDDTRKSTNYQEVLIFTEVYPADGAINGWIELYNNGPHEIDLSSLELLIDCTGAPTFCASESEEDDWFGGPREVRFLVDPSTDVLPAFTYYVINLPAPYYLPADTFISIMYNFSNGVFDGRSYAGCSAPAGSSCVHNKEDYFLWDISNTPTPGCGWTHLYNNDENAYNTCPEITAQADIMSAGIKSDEIAENDGIIEPLTDTEVALAAPITGIKNDDFLVELSTPPLCTVTIFMIYYVHEIITHRRLNRPDQRWQV